MPLTLIDLAARSGENVHTVIEEVTTVAPEWGTVPAVPRAGTSYDVLRRTSLPRGGFRKVGDGVLTGKSTFEREVKPMYVFEAQMNVGEDIVKGQTAASKATLGDVLADEAMAIVNGSTIAFGAQFFYGKKSDAEGFAGLAAHISAAETVDAGGGNGADTTSVYLVNHDASSQNPQGVHFVVGEDGNMAFGDWLKQQVDKGNGKKAMEYVNNFMFYVGLCVPTIAIWRAKCVKLGANNAITNGFNDIMAAAVLAKVPLNRRANLKWYMNRTAALSLQISRSGSVINTGVGGNFAPAPTEAAGIPIVLTDSLVDTETNGNLA